MTPFQSFRFWLRRAPVSDRFAAGVASVVVVAVLALVLVPGSGTSAPSGFVSTPSASGPREGTVATTAASVGTTGGGGSPTGGATPSGTTGNGGTAPPGGAVPTGAGAGNGGPPTGGATPTGGTSGSPAAGTGCVPPPSSAPGVSPSQIKIAITLTNIIGPAADESFGGDPPNVLQADYQAVIDSINAAGGVACRKLVPIFYQANPVDQSDLQQKCLDITQAGVFAEIDQGAFADYPPVMCFAQHHIPYFGSYIVSQAVLDQGYPYLFDFNTYDSLYHNAIFALRDRGFFGTGNGFKKLGFVYRSCYPSIISAFKGWLRQVGVPDAQLVTYDLGCPSAFASPSDVEQAVLKFQTAGVTHVTIAQMVGDFPNFTTVAAQQGFHPKYGFGDDSVLSTTYGSLHPDYSNIDGAIAIVASRIGEERTPGMTPSSGTARCNAIYAAHGKPPVYQRRLGGGGRVCDDLWFFLAAVSHAPALERNALATGLQRAGSVDFSYPEAPNDFNGNRVTHAGEFWRTAQFTSACNCWRVIDPEFRASYK